MLLWLKPKPLQGAQIEISLFVIEGWLPSQLNSTPPANRYFKANDASFAISIGGLKHPPFRLSKIDCRL